MLLACPLYLLKYLFAANFLCVGASNFLLKMEEMCVVAALCYRYVLASAS